MGLNAEIIGGPYDGMIVNTAHYEEMVPWLYLPSPRRIPTFMTVADPPMAIPGLDRQEIHKRAQGADGELYYVHVRLLRDRLKSV